jgi:branched-chain amino acid aminotransferase
LIETSPLDSQKFDLNLQGMAIGVFDEIRLPTLAPSQQFSIQNFKTHSALPFVLAAIFKQEKGWGECLLLNQRGRLACGSSSNVFLVKNGSLFTPPLSEGCVAGTMRSLVLALAKAKGMGVGEKRLRPQDLGAAEEVFLTNAIQGIRWVAGYGGSVYDNKVAEVLHQAIIAVAAHGG